MSGERSDPAFKRPVAEAARYIQANPGDTHRFRIVAGQSGFGPRDVERTVLAARLSLTANDFWQRWADPAAANAGERAFANAVAWVTAPLVMLSSPPVPRVPDVELGIGGRCLAAATMFP